MNELEDTKVYDKEETEIDVSQNQDNEESSKEIDSKKKKTTFKEKWQSFSKKKKALIIIGIILFLVVIAVLVYFITKKDKVIENPVEEVTIENQNYRYQNGTLYFYDKEKNEIGTYECKNKDEEKCFLAFYTLDSDVDNTRYIYENEEDLLFQTPIVSNKYVFVSDNSDDKDTIIRLYNFKEQKEISIYQEVKKATDDYTFILKDDNGKYGVISLKDDLKKIIDFKYDYLGYYDDAKIDNYIAYLNDKYYILNGKDSIVSKPIKEKIVGYNDNYIKAKNDSKYYVYDYNGIRKLNDSSEFIAFLRDYIITVNKSLIYILDKEGNKLNVEGLKVNNNYYRKAYIYDDNKKLLKIVNSFDANLDGNNIVIDIYNDTDKETHVINALEAAVNSKLEYISYIDGKLYFYSDLEKKNQIGSYVCKNKNSITSIDSELTSCYLAKQVDTTYLPIINGRYVFINDTLDADKQAIALYDLKDNKVLGNYLEIDVILDKDARFITTDSLNVIALSAKKNKYGMIKISSSSVKSVLEFANQGINRLDDLYIVNKSSGTYLAYDKDGKVLTSEFADEIVSYNQSLDVVMTTKNNKYNLFKSDGTKLTSKSYENIEAYPKYIVAIDGKKLDVLNYEGKAYCDECMDITLYNSSYDDAYNIDDKKISIYNGSEINNEVYFEE